MISSVYFHVWTFTDVFSTNVSVFLIMLKVIDATLKKDQKDHSQFGRHEGGVKSSFVWPIWSSLLWDEEWSRGPSFGVYWQTASCANPTFGSNAYSHRARLTCDKKRDVVKLDKWQTGGELSLLKPLTESKTSHLLFFLFLTWFRV